MVRSLVLVFVVLAAGCSNGATNKTEGAASQNADAADGTVLAVVNGVAITSSAFEEMANRRIPPSVDGIDDDRKRELLEELINEQLLFEQSLKTGMQFDPTVRRALVTALLKRDVYRSGSDQDVSEEESRAYFESHKEEFVVPAKVQLRTITLSSDDTEPQAEFAKRAKDMAELLRKSPEGFRELARRNSKDIYAQRGGDMGFVSRKGKPGVAQEVIDAGFAMKDGEISDPISSDEGLHIVQTIARRERIERSFEQMRAAVERKVRTERQQSTYREYLDGLRKDVNIEVREDDFKKFDWKPSAQGGPFGGGPLSPLPAAARGQKGKPLVKSGDR